ncbi:MAG: phage tail protein [Caldilineaceae bacterium]|nr:phage tail protein [Caldilineaceae bacterium]
MIGYTVSANQDKVADAISFFEFVGGQTTDAVRIAINKAAPKVRTKASSAIRTQVRLAAAYVNEKLTITRATRQKLSGAIQTPSRGLLLSKFSTDTQVASDKIGWLIPPAVPARGIRVKVKPVGTPKPLSNDHFYMVLPNSRALAIARRREKPGPKGGKIDVLYGPSISQVFNTVRDDVLPEASDIYQEQLLDAMRYILAKRFPQE